MGTMSERESIEARRGPSELEMLDAMLDVVYTGSTDGVAVLRMDGSADINPTAERIMRFSPGMQADVASTDSWGFFRADGTRIRLEETAGYRAMLHGERVDGEDVRIVSELAPEGFTIQTSARPVPGGGSISIFQDVSARVGMEAEITQRVADLDAREAENGVLIERLRVALDDLSTPVLEVWRQVLVLPIVGVVDTQRSVAMSERLLAEVVRTRARVVIIDVTGLEVLDTSTADRFARIARAIELLGARCCLSGLSPAVARTLVDLGVRFSGGIETHSTLRHALESCFARGPELSTERIAPSTDAERVEEGATR
jgi:rsbT co-antagonist protein RsbR